MWSHVGPIFHQPYRHYSTWPSSALVAVHWRDIIITCAVQYLAVSQRSQVELSFLHPVPDFPDSVACPSHRECIIFVSRLPMLFSTPKIVLPIQLHKLWTSHACIRLVYCYSILLEGQEIQSCQVWFWLIFQEKRVQTYFNFSPLSQPLAARPSCGPCHALRPAMLIHWQSYFCAHLFP